MWKNPQGTPKLVVKNSASKKERYFIKLHLIRKTDTRESASSSSSTSRFENIDVIFFMGEGVHNRNDVLWGQAHFKKAH